MWRVVVTWEQALRGLGNLEDVWCEGISQQASAVLSALTTATGARYAHLPSLYLTAEDKDSSVAAEAVASLTRVRARLTGIYVRRRRRRWHVWWMKPRFCPC
jgi:hypothetical protein